MNCACAYSHAAEHNLLLIFFLLRTALTPYWQSLVHLNCACVYWNPLLLHKINKIKMAPKSHKIEYVPIHIIREITRLATMLAGLIEPRLRLGFVSATPRLRLTYASTMPWLRSPASIVARRVITLIRRLGT